MAKEISVSFALYYRAQVADSIHAQKQWLMQ